MINQRTGVNIMHRNAKQIVFLISFVLNASLVEAAMYCSEPSEPSCLLLTSQFRNNHEFSMCKMEIESFAKATADYRRCLQTQGNEAVERYNRIVAKFNCIARGESLCL